MHARPSLVMWGLDHRRASAETRSRAHFDSEKTRRLIDRIRAEEGFISCVPLSTCNRTEIYCDVHSGAGPSEPVASALYDIGVDPDLFMGDLGVRRDGRAAVIHLHRVAAGLESMVLGESQIVSQLKDAYSLASSLGDLGSVMMRAFQSALGTAKRVRSETRIGVGAASVAFAAVELSRRFFARLGDQSALLIGAGATGDLAARHFLQQGIGELTVINRTAARARDLVAALNEKDGARVSARSWDELQDALVTANVVLTATGATEPILLPGQVERALRERRNHPLFLLDIAVPRDVHPDVRQLPDVFVFGIDDLDDIVRSNLAARRREVPRAESIIEREMANFDEWMLKLDLLPTVHECRAYLESLKDRHVGWVRKKESPDVADAVEQSLAQFITKVTGRFMTSLRDVESDDERLQRLATLRRIFGEDKRAGQR